MSEPIMVHVYKSDDGSEKVRGAIIRITAALPRFDPKEVAYLEAQYRADAEELEDGLWRSLPGGTYDQLLGLMLSRKASHFRVSFCDALDHGMRIARLEAEVRDNSDVLTRHINDASGGE